VLAHHPHQSVVYGHRTASQKATGDEQWTTRRQEHRGGQPGHYHGPLRLALAPDRQRHAPRGRIDRGDHDLDGLAAWEEHFGPGYTGLFVFVYWLQADVPAPADLNVYEYDKRQYLMVALSVADFLDHCRRRSLRWQALYVPDKVFLGLIRPDGSIQYYKGPGKGFAALETIESAKRIVSDFPFNTAMSAVLSVTIPAEWPKGTYQFVAAVMDGKTMIETDYGNSFTVR
jgi:hypothetical protein